MLHSQSSWIFTPEMFDHCFDDWFLGTPSTQVTNAQRRRKNDRCDFRESLLRLRAFSWEDDEIYHLVICYIAAEGHRNSEFSYSKWWFSIVSYVSLPEGMHGTLEYPFSHLCTSIHPNIHFDRVGRMQCICRYVDVCNCLFICRHLYNVYAWVVRERESVKVGEIYILLMMCPRPKDMQR